MLYECPWHPYIESLPTVWLISCSVHQSGSISLQLLMCSTHENMYTLPFHLSITYSIPYIGYTPICSRSCRSTVINYYISFILIWNSESFVHNDRSNCLCQGWIRDESWDCFLQHQWSVRPAEYGRRLQHPALLRTNHVMKSLRCIYGKLGRWSTTNGRLVWLV